MILRRDAPVRVRPDDADRRSGPGGGAAAVRLPRVQVAARPAVRGAQHQGLRCAGAVLGERGAARGGDRADLGRRAGGTARRSGEGGRRAGVGGRAGPLVARRARTGRRRRVRRRALARPAARPRSRRPRVPRRPSSRTRAQREAVHPCAARRGRRARRARPRHCDRCLPHRPGGDPLLRRRPAREVHRLPARPGGPRRQGSARLRRHRRPPHPRRGGGARGDAPRRRARERSRQAGDGRALRDDGEPARRGARADGARRDRRRRQGAALAQRQADRRLRAAVGRAAARRRPAVQLQLADPAPRHPLHRTRPLAGEEDEDGLLDGRGDAREAARPVARVHRPAAAVPRGREAPRHLRRGSARRGGAGRPDPRDVQPDGRAHRTAVERPAEPAQHPGTPRGGSPVPQGVRALRGLRAARRRLQPDRAALHRPPRAGPRPDRGVRDGTGHPQRDGVAGVRGRVRTRSRTTSARRRRWSATGWRTAWSRTGSDSG